MKRMDTRAAKLLGEATWLPEGPQLSAEDPRPTPNPIYPYSDRIVLVIEHNVAPNVAPIARLRGFSLIARNAAHRLLPSFSEYLEANARVGDCIANASYNLTALRLKRN